MKKPLYVIELSPVAAPKRLTAAHGARIRARGLAKAHVAARNVLAALGLPSGINFTLRRLSPYTRNMP